MVSRPSHTQPDICDVFCHDEEKVRRLKGKMEETRAAARLFKGLGDETRLKIAYALCLEEELCVCDVAHILGASVATASHHLRLMRKMGLARSRKAGKIVFYTLDDGSVRQMVRFAMKYAPEEIPPAGKRG
ncbi:cadmium-sensing regulator CadC [Melghirimyces profundicolus]|uniref:Cadmium-sensing regulator CadC n=1 Tax=Melghirimyces profundicolus TaxID=1242148 RepID=A0A2T6C4J4_9BACL|nr:metalloregulator ArsR/SmtB family transcription factor [Melghirimyces profundicolus]PTX63212.1 cadmium-sensing regulator CadC [Melghirimyces profundicolus]